MFVAPLLHDPLTGLELVVVAATFCYMVKLLLTDLSPSSVQHYAINAQKRHYVIYSQKAIDPQKLGQELSFAVGTALGLAVAPRCGGKNGQSLQREPLNLFRVGSLVSLKKQSLVRQRPR